MFILKYSTEVMSALQVAKYQVGDNLLFLYIQTKYNKAEKKPSTLFLKLLITSLLSY